jgi:hypothetical protein
VRKQHLGTFAIAPRLLESLGLGEGASNVAASSFTSRTIRREGMFGQHFGLSAHARQSGNDA